MLRERDHCLHGRPQHGTGDGDGRCPAGLPAAVIRLGSRFLVGLRLVAMGFVSISVFHRQQAGATAAVSVPQAGDGIRFARRAVREMAIFDARKWRRGWDSNPRGTDAPNRFRVGAVVAASVPLRV